MAKHAVEHREKAAEHHEQAAHHHPAASHRESVDHHLAAHNAHVAQAHLDHAFYRGAEAAKAHAEAYGEQSKAAFSAPPGGPAFTIRLRVRDSSCPCGPTCLAVLPLANSPFRV